MKNKILIFFPDGVGLRNFAFSEFKSIGESLGYDIVYWNNTIFSLKSNLGFNEINIEEQDIHPMTTIYNRAIKRIELNISKKKYKDSVYELYKFPFSFKGVKDFIKSFITLSLIIRFNSEIGISKLKKRRDLLERKTKKYRFCCDQLMLYKPDLIFFTTQRSSQSIGPLMAARDLGIKTAAFIYSWDNIPKAMQVIETDYYFVWSELMKRQQLKYYPNNSPSKVFVTGTPQFEFHFDKSLRMEREVFFEKYGLDQSKRYLCFSGDDITTSPLDQFYLEDLALSVEQLNHLGYNLGIIYRKCPVDNTNRYDKILAKYRDVIKVIDPDWTAIGGQWNQIVPNQEDKALLYNICEHSELVANVCSTTVFDFVLHNKPCIYFNYEQPQLKKGIRDIGQNYKYVHFRSMPSQRAVIFCHNKNELISLLEETLTNKLSNVAECKKWFEIVAGNQPQGASRNIWKSINSILN